MLCCVSKQEEPGSSAAKDVADVPNGAPAAKLDPRIGLTNRQIFILTKNWKGINRKMEETGVNMFVRMFERTPAALDVFGKKLAELKGQSREAMEKNETLEFHAVAVMGVFDEAINRIGDPPAFFAHLTKYGQLHGRKPGFDPRFFWDMEEPFLFALKLTLEDRYTENMEEIYCKIIKLILQTLADAAAPADAADVKVAVS